MLPSPFLFTPLILTILFSFWTSSLGATESQKEVFEVEIVANIDDVWQAFTTTKGLQSWVAPLADIDLKVGGKWRANYQPKGILGDPSTIENTILSYDPKRMLSLKATGFPEGFEYIEAAQETWSVFYFTPISATKTKITVVGLGYNDTEQSKKMRFFLPRPTNIHGSVTSRVKK